MAYPKGAEPSASVWSLLFVFLPPVSRCGTADPSNYNVTTMSSIYSVTHPETVTSLLSYFIGHWLHSFVLFTYCFMDFSLPEILSAGTYYSLFTLCLSHLDNWWEPFLNSQFLDPLGILFHGISRRRKPPLCCLLPNTSMIIPTLFFSQIFLSLILPLIFLYSTQFHLQSTDLSNPHTLPGWSLSYHSSVQFSSVAHSCPTLCNPTNHSTPGLPVHHQLPSSLKLMLYHS